MASENPHRVFPVEVGYSYKINTINTTEIVDIFVNIAALTAKAVQT